MPASSSATDDWFASPAGATNATAAASSAPPPAAAPANHPGSGGFYSMNNTNATNTAGGSGSSDNNMYSGYGGNAYGQGGSVVGGGGGSNAMSAGTGGGGYYGAGSGGGAYGSSMQGGGMSGAIGGGASSAAIPPSSAFGANPNSGSSGSQMNSIGGGGSFEMSGAMGGPIGGGASAAAAAPAPHVFDPNAAAAQKASEHQSNNNAMTPAQYDEDYENEPPLLEELGVNFPHIYSKSRAVLFPVGKHAKSLESGLIENDADLAGPLAFALGLGGELLLSGKLHFGYVYGFGVSGCMAMTLLLNLLNPNGAVSMWTVVSILGYALLPVNLLAGINVLIRVHKLGKWGMIMAVLTVAWCTAASARLFERGCNMRAQRFLVAYPTALLYTAFVMITIF